MKKLTALVALALLAVAGTGFAVTCAQDNVPAATLLVPYFRVGGAGVVGTNDIPDTSGTDTLVAVTNVSSANIIIHVTLWNKYSFPVLDFNVPMTGFDVVFWSMRSILNGNLLVNPAFQAYETHAGVQYDPCGQTYSSGGTGFSLAYTPFVRFAPPASDNDRVKAISVYPIPAFSGAFRARVWDSLDESGDITNWTGTGANGTGILDTDNEACSGTSSDGAISGDFSGYVTIDVANYCSIHEVNEPAYFINDAIATVGDYWGSYPGVNILMGDVFYKDQAAGTTTANMGNISGDPTVNIEFDSRLMWGPGADKTFYGRYYTSADGLNANSGVYSFYGDGREPLGQEYGFRYMQTAAPTSLRTWILVWRSDIYDNLSSPIVKDLCSWWLFASGKSKTAAAGFTDTTGTPNHKITVNLWDNDEDVVNTSGGPSGGPTGSTQYIYLETQRLVVTPNGQVVPADFLGGWIDLVLPGSTLYNQAWVGVQHSGQGLAMSVGHSATLMNGQFICTPAPLTNWAGVPGPAGIIKGTAAVQTNGTIF